jgi:hypothetical protein
MAGGPQKRHKWERTIAALLSTATLDEAAAVAGISTACLDRWLADPAFQAEYRRLRQDILQRVVGRMVNATVQAVTVLTECMTSGRDAIRLRAAAILLAHAHKGLELCDLAEELRFLQSQIEEVRYAQQHRFATSPAGRDQGNGRPES